MPGMMFVDNFLVHGKLHSGWLCDKCRKMFAFEDGEKLYCPRCKQNGYPMNLDPSSEVASTVGEGQSRIIIPGGDTTKPIKRVE